MHARSTSLALALGALLVTPAAFAQAPPPDLPVAPPPPPMQPAAPPPMQPGAPPPMMPGAPPPMMPGAPPPMMPGAPPPMMQPGAPPPMMQPGARPPMMPGAPPMMPPGSWPAPSAPSAAEMPPSDTTPPPPALAGVTAKGLPFSQRGGLGVDFAAMRFSNASSPSTAIDVIAHIPLTDRTFFDAVLPIGFGALGNPMVGVHHVTRPMDALWITVGGAFGVPLINASGFENFQYARGFWDMQEFAQFTVPFVGRFGLEGHAGIAEFRLQIEPVIGISVKPGDAFFVNGVNHLFTVQHAFEAQIGHAIGGGLRYQGVAIATDSVQRNGSSSRFDHYQGAMELFFRIYKDPIFARVGFVIPLDQPLGESNNARTWGVRLATGWSLD